MNLPDFNDNFVDELLFRNGLTLDHYVIRTSPISEAVCYSDGTGREFYLRVSNDTLMLAVLSRLRRLGVRRIDSP